jgi:caspase domain-containing protein
MKLGRLRNFLNSRVISGVLTSLIMILSIAWYISDRGFEPLIAAIGGVLGFVGLFKYSFLSFDKNLVTDRIALVVGNSHYPFGNLLNVKSDTEAVCKSLKAKGFKIIKRDNPNRSELLKAIYDFQTILSTGGVGFFYYAGHAGQIDGRDLILPVDVGGTAEFGHSRTQNRERDIAFSFRPKSREDFLRFAIDLNALLGPVDKIIEESPDHNGSVIIYSTASGAKAIDASEEFNDHSPFARIFLGLMEKWNLEIFDLFRLLCQRVSAVTHGSQIPWLAASLNVEFYFKPIIPEKIGILKILVFDACRTNPFARTPFASLFERTPEPEASPPTRRL